MILWKLELSLSICEQQFLVFTSSASNTLTRVYYQHKWHNYSYSNILDTKGEAGIILTAV